MVGQFVTGGADKRGGGKKEKSNTLGFRWGDSALVRYDHHHWSRCSESLPRLEIENESSPSGDTEAVR